MTPYRYTVRLGDTDAAGVLFGPTLPRILHDAYEACMEQIGQPVHLWVVHPRLALPLVHLSADFSKPVRHGDLLEIVISIRTPSRSSFTLDYVVQREGVLVARGTSVHVVASRTSGRPAPIPPTLRNALKRMKPS